MDLSAYKNVANIEQKLHSIAKLLSVMEDLREKCPWDKKQTNQTLSSLTIEEVYELTDAILKNENKHIKEELGDVLLHIIFYAKIGEEQGLYDIGTIAKAEAEKLIHRHPHVYDDTKVENEQEVKRNWEKLKIKEGRKSILSGVPQSLPAIIKAYRLQEKTAQVGFEWEKIEDVWIKVEEEISELKNNVDNKVSKEKIEDEVGDVFFALINYARFLKIDPEQAINRTNQKFIKRFEYIEQYAQKNNRSLSEMTLKEMDDQWNNAKNQK